jgi:hypothetical protein
VAPYAEFIVLRIYLIKIAFLRKTNKETVNFGSFFFIKLIYFGIALIENTL